MESEWYRGELFQFHLGSIRGCYRAASPRRSVHSFQFHLGSIRGPASTRLCNASSHFGFNSTLVRLEVARAAKRCRQAFDHLLFQFHLGSIRGISALSAVRTSCSCFNSTLVRLEGRSASEHCWRAWERFNSTLVRLEVPVRHRCRCPQRGFNSTLVRLEASLGPTPNTQGRVSIPPWFD